MKGFEIMVEWDEVIEKLGNIRKMVEGIRAAEAKGNPDKQVKVLLEEYTTIELMARLGELKEESRRQREEEERTKASNEQWNQKVQEDLKANLDYRRYYVEAHESRMATLNAEREYWEARKAKLLDGSE